MAKVPICPYCNSEVVIPGKVTSITCPRCKSVCRIVSGKLYRSEEVPPEVSCCFVGLYANIARSHEAVHDEAMLDFLEDFLRKQNLTKKQYEYLKKTYAVESKRGFSFGGHESNKSYVARFKTVIDDICSTMPLSEQGLYEDSVLKMLISFMLKGGGINEDDEKLIGLYKAVFGIEEKR